MRIEDLVFDPRNAVAARREQARRRLQGRRTTRRPTPPAASCTASSSARSRRSRAPVAPAGTSTSAPTATRCRSSSSSTWPASAGTRLATSRSPCKLSEHMGTEIGEFAEQTLLFEAACNSDPVLRLTGVNRALEGLAIDVFNTMRDFGDATTDPGPLLLRGLDAGRRGHPREDGLRLAAPHHRRRSRAPQAGPRLPAHRRQAVQLRRLPRRGRGEPDPPGPQVPRRSPGSTTTRSPTWSTPRPRPTPRPRRSGPPPAPA